MGTITIPDRTDGQTITESWFDTIQSAMIGDWIPRNSGGVAESLAGSCGTITYKWNVGYFQSLNVGGSALDTSLLTASPNRLISGKANSSGFMDFLTPAGVAGGLTATIEGLTTNLEISIDSAQYSVIQDIVTAAMTAAPTSNNTCLVDNIAYADEEYTKYIGEFGYETIIIDAGGSELDTLTGSIQPFSHGAGPEVFIGELTSVAGVGTIKPILRGVGGTKREEFSNNDTITLLKAGYLFINKDVATVDISYQHPTWSKTSPSGAVAGQYWYDMSEGQQTWKEWSGAAWASVDYAYLGYAINDGTDVLWVEHELFDKGFKALNGMRITVKDNTDITINAGSYVDVAGTSLFWDKDIDVALSSNLDEGAETSSTRYWVYVDVSGQFRFSIQRPRLDSRSRERYHPYELWRCVYEVYNDGSSNLDSGESLSYEISEERPSAIVLSEPYFKQRRDYLAHSGAYTFTDTDGVSVLDVTTGASTRVVTLPPLASNFERIVTVKIADSDTGRVTLTPDSGTIDGDATKTISEQYNYLTVLCGLTNYHIVGYFNGFTWYEESTTNTLSINSAGGIVDVIPAITIRTAGTFNIDYGAHFNVSAVGATERAELYVYKAAAAIDYTGVRGDVTVYPVATKSTQEVFTNPGDSFSLKAVQTAGSANWDVRSKATEYSRPYIRITKVGE